MVDKINKYWWHDGHFNEYQRDFFIEILEKIKPKYILEIGFASGRSCSTCLSWANPIKMISIDIDLDYMGARNHADLMMKDFNNLKIIEGDSKILITKDFLEGEFPTGLDFIFVDGGHSYNDAYSDMENTFNHLSENGVMIIDDYYSGSPDGCSIKDVDNAVDDFVKKNNLNFTKWNNNGKGFCIIKK